MIKRTYRVRCVHCGKETAPRIPKGGDTSLWLPRRHKIDGRPCPGNTEEAIIIEKNNDGK